MFKLKELIVNSKTFIVLIAAISVNAAVYADNVDDFFIAKMAQLKIPGVQLAVVKDGKIVKTKSYGIANVQDAVKVDNDTVFNIASMTKAFTCIAMMQLAEQGKLALNDTISTYLTDLPEAWQHVTVYQILSHSSGLPDIMNQHFQLIDSAGEQESWQKLMRQPMLFEPGKAFHYNQTNYLLAGKIIERVSGASYSKLVTQQLKKVGMTKTLDAGFAHFKRVNQHQARDYRYDEQDDLTVVLTYFPSIIRAGAGMSSNALELAKWSLAIKQGEFFDKQTSLKTLWKAAPLSDDNWALDNPNMHPYALGWYVVERPLNRKIVTAGGGQSALAVYPDDDLTLVILTNLAGAKPELLMDEAAEFYIEDFALSDPMKHLKDMLEQQGYERAENIAKAMQKDEHVTFDANELHHFAELLIKHNKRLAARVIMDLNNQLFSKVKLTQPQRDQYVGEYQLADFSIRVHQEADALFITATGDDTLPIFSVTDRQFLIKKVNALVTFQEGKNGAVDSLVLQLNDQKLIGKKLQ